MRTIIEIMKQSSLKRIIFFLSFLLCSSFVSSSFAADPQEGSSVAEPDYYENPRVVHSKNRKGETVESVSVKNAYKYVKQDTDYLVKLSLDGSVSSDDIAYLLSRYQTTLGSFNGTEATQEDLVIDKLEDMLDDGEITEEQYKNARRKNALAFDELYKQSMRQTIAVGKGNVESFDPSKFTKDPAYHQAYNRANRDKKDGIFSEDETKNSLLSKLDSIQSEIDEYNSKIIQCLENIGNIASSIIQLKTQAANSSSGNTSNLYSPAISNASGASSLSGGQTTALNVQAGSGAELAAVDGDLSICLDRVASSLGTSRQGAADYITTLCNTVGKGYFDPKVILSQIFSESSGIQSCSTTATSDFVGLGQMSEVAVQEVNNQFGTNFTFNDMNDAAKNLEAMVYLMTYQYERYGNNLGAAITAYNVGHFSGTVNGYAQKILSRV